MKNVKIEQECCICYLETKNKTICMHDVCIDCLKKIDICPICRREIVEEVYIQTGAIKNYEVSNFGNVRMKGCGKIMKHALDKDGLRTVLLFRNACYKKYSVRELQFLALTYLYHHDTQFKMSRRTKNDWLNITGKVI